MNKKLEEILRLPDIDQRLPLDLGGGLRLRYATTADTEALASFNVRIFFTKGEDEDHIKDWTRSFMSENHPTCGPSNTMIVEDDKSKKIVSSMCIIPQTWTYAGIPFSVGRPEGVGTDPDYRHRGLVRLQFAAFHARSAAMGHLVQAITGIRWYYRQFGYEYAMNLLAGRSCFLSNIPELKEGQEEPFRLRPLTPTDLPVVERLYERESRRWLVACPRPALHWQILLGNVLPGKANLPFMYAVESRQGRMVGYLVASRDFWHDSLVVQEFALVDGQPAREVMPSVLRALKLVAIEESSKLKIYPRGLFFPLGREHPFYRAAPEFFPKVRIPYAWYARVADIPAFLRLIKPVLEERLAASVMSGFSGSLKISEYISGFRLEFNDGKITAIESWKPDSDPKTAFPPLVFLQLLFGRANLDELCLAYPDCSVDDEAFALLDVLFPKQESVIIPLD